MPDAFEFPRTRGAVIPLMRAGNAGIFERVADRVPRFAAVVRALHDLTEPAAGLRRVQPLRIGGRAFHVINFPAAEMRAADIPFLALAVGTQNEGALAGTDQNSH